MSLSQELDAILLRARRGGLLKTPSVLLSEVAHTMCRERSQHTNPEYISESACHRLLSKHPEIFVLLETAVQSGVQDGLWRSSHLCFLGDQIAAKDDATWTKVEDLLGQLFEAISTLATQPGRVDDWPSVSSFRVDNPDTAESSAEFVESLHLFKGSDGFPALLLHNLGSLIDEKRLTDRLSHIFVPNEHTLLINSSGSGKTRLLFEGLCRHWGLYMTCAVDTSGVGCPDVSYAISFGLQSNSSFNGVGGLDELEIARNRCIAEKVFSLILLSRLVLLCRFLEAVPAAERDTNETRKRWLYLQVIPHRFGCQGLLSALFDGLTPLSSKRVRNGVHDALQKIRSLLGVRDLPLFCAVDECQVASQEHYGAFGDDSSTLHQMALTWQKVPGVTVIATGTSVNMAPFVDPARTTYRVCTDTGAFDAPDEQRRYATRYMPPALISSYEGQQLVSRIWSWLRGRHRFTAAFIECLLRTNFQQPHQLLDAYIRANLRIDLIDKHLTSGRARLRRASRKLVEDFCYFTGESLGYDLESWFSAHYAVHKLLLGQSSVTLTENCFSLAAHGLAHFTHAIGKEVSIYEPTVLYPFLRPLFYDSGVVPGFLPDAMAARLCAVPKHNSLPLTLASLLLHALKDGPRPLTNLFLFPGTTPDWATQTAELVCVTRQGNNASRTWTDQSSFRRARGEDAWISDSPKWAEQRSLQPFCEASKFSTADLLFVLRLANGQCLRVAVATMLHNAHVQLSSADIEEKLSSLVPSKLFPPNLAPATARPLSLPHLGQEASAADDPSLLRVVCTFPYEFDINAVERDGHAQPIAAINMAAMREVAGSLKSDDVARRLLNVLTGTGRRTAKRKRCEDGDDDERPRKRAKSMAVHVAKEAESQQTAKDLT
ncbi:uncharacterized protein SCHCODRAFT_02581788 [Schizophyllum commune H4-8]|uniref:uncharacterized protein n=1 Tax=Schizophyllum commune (strain H4-8 / FGSC 9210) TaxID=578458 RepID=UPI00215E7B6A|nr:uncharacterized protein SCHCODRAFT_02581788 [Schizophyllum commune H4-8]KAI5891722.1 hypothetical protein SCHCODRAFT_02581788 [Schizophyllum commune H4-8]